MMADDRLLKPEQDFSLIFDEQWPAIERLAETNLPGALERLSILEKKTRQASDTATTTRILKSIVVLCADTEEYALLKEQVSIYSKRHGQIKQSLVTMIQDAMAKIDDIKDPQMREDYIEGLRSITEGKIYAEIERARLTKILTDIKENDGDIEAAAEIFVSEPVETYGSLDVREKTEYILDQIRFLLLKGDYYTAGVYSKKINRKFFDDPANEELKLKFFNQQIEIGLQKDQYLDISKYYQAIYSTNIITENEAEWQSVLSKIVLFCILAVHDNEQSDLMHRISKDVRLDSLPLMKQLLQIFLTKEIVRWPRVEEIFGDILRVSDVFSGSDSKGDQRWADLKKRIIEHNLRVISGYYDRIYMDRLNELLDLDDKESEEYIARLVTSGMIYARIDRPERIVSFMVPKNTNDVLNEWSTNLSSLLNKIENTRQLILKEEMIHSIGLGRAVSKS